MPSFPGPRVELHCHLDGSVRPATIDELARTQGLDLGDSARQIAVAPSGCRDFGRYLRAIEPALAVLQSADALARAARELVEDWACDGVVHGEVRFAPQLHARSGLTPKAAVEAVESGLRAGREQHAVTTSLLVCCLRTDDGGLSNEVARLAISRTRNDPNGDPCDGVAGLDLAGDEAAVSGARHVEAFRLARQAGLPITVHAGELCGPDSIREALDLLGAQRIGHATSVLNDAALVARVVQDEIVVESCPLSNEQTGSGPRLAEHPLPGMLDRGVRASVSTDCRTVSGVDLRAQEVVLDDAFGWSYEQHATAQINAAQGAFLPDDARRALVDHVRSAHGRL
ncbi:MAG: adenosine deaminase [Actinomycetia bacterium]|nr:adenosine deaminase [Actinomycetes bacterium]